MIFWEPVLQRDMAVRKMFIQGKETNRNILNHHIKLITEDCYEIFGKERNQVRSPNTEDSEKEPNIFPLVKHRHK